MSDEECIHGIGVAECATCRTSERRVSDALQGGRIGHEKSLIYCPRITDDSLLHFNRQDESYRLRAFVGRLSGRAPWRQPDALTASKFLDAYRPEVVDDVAGERVSLEHADRWAAIITAHNRRRGIGG